MAKYYILTQNIKTEENKLIETINANSLAEARNYASKKHIGIITSVIETGEKLVVVGEAGYKQYYKKEA